MRRDVHSLRFGGAICAFRPASIELRAKSRPTSSPQPYQRPGQPVPITLPRGVGVGHPYTPHREVHEAIRAAMRRRVHPREAKRSESTECSRSAVSGTQRVASPPAPVPLGWFTTCRPPGMLPRRACQHRASHEQEVVESRSRESYNVQLPCSPMRVGTHTAAPPPSHRGRIRLHCC